MTDIIATFKNIEYGIEVYVTEGHMGYHVSLKDTDANEFVDTVIGYKDLSKALTKAENIANGVGPVGWLLV